jgi:hypothetical protein
MIMADEKQVEKKDNEPTKMEVGGTGTATAKFKDSFGKEVKVKTVQWAANGSIAITPDEKDPATAKFLAVGAGPATIRAEGVGEEGGHAEARIELMVLAQDEAAEGEVTVTVQKAAPKKKPEPVKEPASAAQGQHGHVATHA